MCVFCCDFREEIDTSAQEDEAKMLVDQMLSVTQTVVSQLTNIPERFKMQQISDKMVNKNNIKTHTHTLWT